MHILLLFDLVWGNAHGIYATGLRQQQDSSLFQRGMPVPTYVLPKRDDRYSAQQLLETHDIRSSEPLWPFLNRKFDALALG